MSRFFLLIFAFFLLSGFYFQNTIGKNFDQWRKPGIDAQNELSSQAYIHRILATTGEFDPTPGDAVWFDKKVSPPPQDLAQRIMAAPSNVLGESNGMKWIDIDLSTQKLYAKEGDRIVYEFPISSGLPWMPTVTGEFYIWGKVRAQRMSGGSVANGTYYNLPNVPFVQYFHKAYGLHGTYWHNDFGKPRSHGCVNLRISDAQLLFDWTSPTLGPGQYARYNIKPEESVKVVVHGKTPPA